MITNRRSQEKFNSKNGVNRPPLYDLSVYCGGLSWRKTNMVMKSKLLEKGQRFGLLTVIKLDHIRTRYKDNGWKENIEYYLCQCDCGNTKIVEKAKLRLNRTTSCGCIGKKHMKELMTTHGKTRTKLYRIFTGIKTRCYNKKTSSYKYYGLRGITVCDEWKNNFQSFYDWAIANGYRDDLTIDRIDVNGNYEPNNCRWVTMKEQGSNKRNTIIVEYKNEKVTLIDLAEKLNLKYDNLKYYYVNKNENIEKCIDLVQREYVYKNRNEKYTWNNETLLLKQWAEKLNIDYEILVARIKNGWSIERAFTTKLHPYEFLITYNGETKNLKTWAKEFHIGRATLSYRLKHGWDVKTALTTPKYQKNRKRTEES